MTTPVHQSIWLQTNDGAVHQLQLETARLILSEKRLQDNQGLSKTSPIVLPVQVGSDSLELIIEFHQFYNETGHSEKEHKMLRKKFFKLGLNRLCELVTAAWILELRVLTKVVCDELAIVIDRMADDEFMEAFKTDASSRQRLLHELRAKEKANVMCQSSFGAEGHREISSLDFEPSSEGTGQDVHRFKGAAYKKIKRTKQKAEDSKLPDNPENRTQGPHRIHSSGNTRQSVDNFGDGQGAESSGKSTEGATDGGPEDYCDNDLDLEKNEEIDKDVDEFQRRLLLSWPDRVQEIFALASESQAGRTKGPLVSSDSESFNSAVPSTYPHADVQHADGSAHGQKTKSSFQCTFGRFLFISIFLLLLYFLVYS